MASKSLNLLPDVFKTTANRKFLSATIEQLISEPEFKKINGYIGRKLSPTYKNGDNYIPEPTTDRTNYQLEPSLVLENDLGEIEHYASYIDLLHKIRFYGGDTSNPSRLFAGTTASYNAVIDLDKLVNFNKYWWMPYGPEIVNIYSTNTPTFSNYRVKKNQMYYSIDGLPGSRNPEITLLRGRTYTFTIHQEGKFWIQTNANRHGFAHGSLTVSSREVFGVTNNGIENGVVTFAVPREDDQAFYAGLQPYADHPVVDFATTIQYNQMHNHLLSTFTSRFVGLDGPTPMLDGKTVIFVGSSEEDLFWDPTVPEFFGGNFDTVPGYSGMGTMVPQPNRAAVWRINLIPIPATSDYVIQLTNIGILERNEKVFILNGSTRGGHEYYRDALGSFRLIPQLTAHLTELYYVDESSPYHFGKIKIKDPDSGIIDVENDIIGQRTYVSPNGVILSSGMRIRFDESAYPEKYANAVFYVEGVGKSIELIPENELQNPELLWMVKDTPFDVYPYDSDNYDSILISLERPEYITISRASIDRNSWSRSNRWVHEDVLIASARYNGREPGENENPLYKGIRAARPIIEFNPNFALFNYGRRGRGFVDHFITRETNAFVEFEENTIYHIDDVPIKAGETILFSKDVDPLVRNRKYQITFVTIDGREQLHLIPVEEQMEKYDVVVPMYGKYQGINFWFDGTNWIDGQRKRFANQIPLFELIDIAGNKISDPSVYPGTTFKGNKLFGYSETTSSSIDKNLGFPIKYKNFSTIGDIEFTNFHQTGSFVYYKPSNSVIGVGTAVNSKTSDYFIAKISKDRTLVRHSEWVKVSKETRQSVIFTFENTSDNTFRIDVMPDQYNETDVQVIVNGVKQPYTTVTFIREGNDVYCNIDYESIGNNANKIDLIIYSKEKSKIGYYSVPRNLDMNALNKTFETITLGQMRNHISVIGDNTHDLVGNVPGSSNIRDLDINDVGGSILQHEAPVIYAQLFLTHNVANFVNSIFYAQREYTRFKNRFLETANMLDSKVARDPKNAVDAILEIINASKNALSPWYASDMAAFGKVKTTTTYTVLNSDITDYEITDNFDGNVVDHRAVIVYHNDVQLIRGRDYVFRQNSNVISFKIELEVGDKIVVDEYPTTDGNCIPETPSKLGLYPTYIPEIRFDNTYREPTDVIIGHDGSITPVFGDFRDNILLELEKRIYNNIKIKTVITLDKLYEFVPGKFREAGGYTRKEFNSVISSQFLRWIGNYRIDFTNNAEFDGNDPWTWNYSKNIDRINGEALPGHWRGVYRYFFDTDAPHIEPWVMLGFSEMPSWWEEHYGPAPYTGGNLVMWRDIEEGRIVDGPTAGVYPELARPGITNVIPVDEFGNLRSPAEFAMFGYNSSQLGTRYSFGDVAPVESAWRRSSEYPYAVQLAMALMFPAKYFGMLIDTYQFRHDDVLNISVNQTGNFVNPTAIKLNNENGYHTGGYLNLISNYLTSLGYNGNSKIRELLEMVSVRLGHNMAGYTDRQYLQVFAEQASPSSVNESVLLPDENIKVFLHKTSPLAKVSYSAVVVERAPGGFSIKGYDTNNPYFVVLPVNENSEFYAVKEIDYSVKIYKSHSTLPEFVPYGTVFETIQDVSNFLISYGNYLSAIGFNMDSWNPNFETLQNFELSVREFLVWAQQGWKSGSVIVLSPVFDNLKFESAFYVVDEITNNPLGSKILDQNFLNINPSDFSIVRDDNTFELNTRGRMIAYAELHLVQFEHVIVFDNETIFKDIIYLPETGNRQFRLKLVGAKTLNWTGKFDPPGFIYNSSYIESWVAGKDYKRGDLVTFKRNYYVATQAIAASDEFKFDEWTVIDKEQLRFGLLRNFATNAKQFTSYYDVDAHSLDETSELFAKGLIGFRPRKYLAELGLDVGTQLKFYQGMIRDKGTTGAISALSGKIFNTLTNNIDVYEEWAIKMGDYGGVTSNQYFEILMPTSDTLSSDPVVFSLVDVIPENKEAEVSYITKSLLYKEPYVYKKNFLPNRGRGSVYENDIKTAGFVKREDVDATLFSIDDISSLDNKINELYDGFVIWVAKNNKNDWDVLRVFSSRMQTIEIIGEEHKVIIKTTDRHGLVSGDLIAIRTAGSINGFGKVTSINSLYSFDVEINHVLSPGETISSDGTLYTLRSVRFDYLTDIGDVRNISPWSNINRVWVNDATGNGEWGVYQKHEHFVKVSDRFPVTPINGAKHGYSVAISEDANYNYAAATAGYIELATATNTIARYNLPPFLLSTSVEFGADMVVGASRIVVSDPGYDNNRGRVIVYRRFITGEIEPIQEITGPMINADFGRSIAISKDSRWLFVGSPNNDKVYVYLQTHVPYTVHEDLTESGVFDYSLPGSWNGPSLSIYINGVLISPTQYIVTGTTLTLLFDPGNGRLHAKLNSYYSLSGVIEGVDYGADVGSKFGYSVVTSEDASKLVIGAPYNDVVTTSGTFIDAGTVFVVSRRDYSFVPDDITDTVNIPIGNVVSVIMNGNVLRDPDDYTVSGTNVIFSDPVNRTSSVLIITDSYVLSETLVPDNVKYAMRFGYAVEITPDSGNIFASAPYWNETTYHSGLVYYYNNVVKSYKVATIKFPVAVGNSLLINGVEVISTSTTLAGYVNDINLSAIPGVSANVIDDILVINGANNIVPGIGVVFANIGLSIYNQTQVIRRPDVTIRSDQLFGVVLAYSTKNNTLAITSKNADAISLSVYDDGETEIDGEFTVIYDRVNYAGVVYLFEYIEDVRNSMQYPGKYAFVQTVKDNTIGEFDMFGNSLMFSGDTLVIGSPMFDRSPGVDTGKLVVVNATMPTAWDKVRAYDNKVDQSYINRAFVYDTVTNEIIIDLDIIDVAKGKILGLARENIDFVTEHDPAQYNRGITLGTSSSMNTWGELQVGTVWWDLTNYRTTEYEQGSVLSRMSSWGEMFEKSTVDVYEWIESDLLPSEYVESGLPGFPKNPDNSRYSVGYKVDQYTGEIRNTFYYWVANAQEVPRGKRLKTSTIAEYIRNPRSVGVPYMAVLNDSSFAIYNIGHLLTSSTYSLHIEYAVNMCGNKSIPVHTEYSIAQEGNPNFVFPEYFVQKVFDSLTGADIHRRRVPDITLKPAQRYGISANPRQTMFVNRRAAVKVAIDFLNNICKEFPVATTRDLTDLFKEYPYPDSSEYDHVIDSYEAWLNLGPSTFPDGTRLLIKSDSEHGNRWSLNHVVDGKLEVIKLQTYRTAELWRFVDWFSSDYDQSTKFDYIVDDEISALMLDYQPGELIFVRNSWNGGYVVYRVQNDMTRNPIAIQNGTIQILPELHRIEGFDIGFFGSGIYDTDISIPLRVILETFRNKILVNEYSDRFSKLLFALIKYVLTEQKNVDWIFKTSFITVLHQFRKLEQTPIYIRDNQSYYADHIAEVKPYRTKVREYLIDYSGETQANIETTDFDLPSYYDKELKTWRSPSGEHPRDSVLLDIVPHYQAWKMNNQLELLSLNIIDGGTGYQESLYITVTGAPGDTPSVVEPVVNPYTGTVLSINIKHPGAFSVNPTITISGTGTGLKLSPVIGNKKVRSIATKIAFDRVSYGNDTDTMTAAERVIEYYKPTANMPAKKLSAVMPGVEFTGNRVIGIQFTESEELIDTTITSNFTDGELLTSDEAIIINGGKFVDKFHSHAPEEFVPGICYDTLSIMVFTGIDTTGVYGINPITNTYNTLNEHYGFRMFNDMHGVWHYQRISGNNITTLVSELTHDATEIEVADSSVLMTPNEALLLPGVIFIGAERIEYYEKDGNFLRKLQRGTRGTSVAVTIPSGTPVIDAGLYTQTIPGAIVDGDPVVWLNVLSTPSDPEVEVEVDSTHGSWFAANTSFANFVKLEQSGNPYSLIN